MLTADQLLLVMRPYQIVATERILQKIEISTNYKKLGTLAGGRLRLAHHGLGQDADQLQGRPAGATAGRTSTRFCSSSTARTSTTRPCASTTASRRARPTRTPQRRCSRSSSRTRARKIIITTIQKLATFIAANKGHAIYDGHVVIIFDECHRSQFGDMHTAITKAFKRYHLFGFTGTPIFAVNASSGGNRTADHRAGLRLLLHGDPTSARPSRTSWHAYLHDRRRHQRQERAAVPHRLRQHDQGSPKASRTSRSRPSTPSGAARSRADRQVVGYTLEHFDQKTRALRHTLSQRSDVAADVTASRRSEPAASTASTRCSPRRRSRPPSATTPSSPSSRRTCRRTGGSRSA